MQQQKKKRVLVVSQHFWPESFRVNDLVRGFMESGLEVDVLCGLPNYPAGEWFSGYRYTRPRRQSYGGAEVFRSGEVRRKGNTSLRIFLNYVSFPIYALFSLPRLRGRRYSAVLCYNTSPVMMALPAIVYAKLHRIPLTTYVLDLWPDNLYSVLPVKNRLLRGIARRVSRWHYRRAARLAALSEGAAEVLRGMTAAKKKAPAVAVIPQYCEDFYAEDVHDAAVAERLAPYFNILFAGNISPAQDLANLVSAMKTVRAARGGHDVRVVVLGDGMSRGALEHMVEAEGLGGAFLFCGAVPPREVPRWTGAADALFMGLAKSENLGLTLPGKLASYLAAAKPVLAAMDGEGAKAARQSGAALVSGAGDADGLAQNILALRAMPAESRAAMGGAGRRYYQRHFLRGAILKRLISFVLEGTS